MSDDAGTRCRAASAAWWVANRAHMVAATATVNGVVDWVGVRIRSGLGSLAELEARAEVVRLLEVEAAAQRAAADAADVLRAALGQLPSQEGPPA